MKKKSSLQIGLVFIGTIVGAGLASGQEITQFFTNYGKISFIALFIPLIIYIILGKAVINISIKHNLNSYSELCTLVSPGFLGKATGFVTTLYLLSSCSIIIAGSGALLNQYFGIPKIVGSLILILIAILTLMKNTDGLFAINSLIVPMLISIIAIIFIFYVGFSPTTSIESHSIYPHKNLWVISAILYGGFNIMGCSGVIVPLSSEIKDKKKLVKGLLIGAISLTVISLAINYLLSCNFNSIHKFEIPLLFVADRFGKVIQGFLLMVIFFEMFSTIVSDTFSISKTLDSALNIPYKYGMFIVLTIGFFVSQLGFKNLISTLYPAFGVISVFFMISVLIYNKKDKQSTAIREQ